MRHARRFSQFSRLPWVLAGVLGVAGVAAEPPYPPSAVIERIEWDPATTVVREAEGSDTWPITWADDGDLYTAFGDGRGFAPRAPHKLSLGFARVSGGPTGFTGTNIRSPSGERKGAGAAGPKASGLLMVDGVLYAWIRNADGAGEQCRLAWSADRARTWTWEAWTFPRLGYCAFLNFGRNYAGARDGYVYTYSPDTASAYRETDRAVLARAPAERIRDRRAYEFFAGASEGGEAAWTADFERRAGVFRFPGGVNRLDVTHHPGLDRYLLTLRSRGRAGGENQFSIYDAPEPWGPWTTAYYTGRWEGRPLSSGNGGWGESQHIPGKWIDPDTGAFYLVFSGKDAFSVRRGTPVTAGRGRKESSGPP